MALLEKHLFVDESTIPGAGKGLFNTNIEIEKGARIIEYKGRRTTWKEVRTTAPIIYLYHQPQQCN
jgi:hypothetical protein